MPQPAEVSELRSLLIGLEFVVVPSTTETFCVQGKNVELEVAFYPLNRKQDEAEVPLYGAIVSAYGRGGKRRLSLYPVTGQKAPPNEKPLNRGRITVSGLQAGEAVRMADRI